MEGSYERSEDFAIDRWSWYGQVCPPEGLSVQGQNLKHSSKLTTRFTLTRTCVQRAGSYWKEEIELTHSQSSCREKYLNEQVSDSITVKSVATYYRNVSLQIVWQLYDQPSTSAQVLSYILQDMNERTLIRLARELGSAESCL